MTASEYLPDTGDLIWTDLLHADAVVVWFSDGAGRFERVSAEEFAPDFTLGGFSVTQPDEDQREQASDDETNSSVALEDHNHCGPSRAPAITDRPQHLGTLPTGATQHLTSRGPPSLLS